MESRRQRLKKAAFRKKGKDSFPGPGAPSAAAGPGGSPRKFFSIAAGAFILALVAFVCGVHMGKGFSDLRWSEEAGPRIQDTKEQAPPFRFMEKGKESPLPPDSRPRSSEDAESRKSPVAARPAEKGAPEKTAPLPRETSAPASEAGKPGVVGARYTLQVGAFNNAQEARDLVNQLKKKGYDAYQVTGTAAAKGTLHRVRIGHFQTLQEARQFAMSFEKKENLKPIISSLQNP